MVGCQGRSNNFYDGASAHNDSLGAMNASSKFDGQSDNTGSGSNIPGVANPGRS